MSRLGVKHCSRLYKSRFKMQKREFKFYEARLIENRKKVNSVDFKSGPSP